jgi:predicted O-methyltransferase YrrM
MSWAEASGFDLIWARADVIEGWLTRPEAELLARLNVGTWCEIGSYKGRSTIVLALTGDFGYAIDWFQGTPRDIGEADTLDEFWANLDGIRNRRFIVIAERHEDAAREVPPALDLLFLDGDHSFEATASAFSLYAPKVKVGGHVVLHDVWSLEGDANPGNNPLPGCRAFFEGLMLDNTLRWGRMDEPTVRWEHTENVDRCAVLRRVS